MSVYYLAYTCVNMNLKFKTCLQIFFIKLGSFCPKIKDHVKSTEDSEV